MPDSLQMHRIGATRSHLLDIGIGPRSVAGAGVAAKPQASSSSSSSLPSVLTVDSETLDLAALEARVKAAYAKQGALW